MRTAVESWVEEPLLRFVDDARVQLVLLLDTSGRVLAQHGFSRSIEVMSACALAAAIHASSAELGRQLGAAPFGSLHHAGGARQIFLSGLSTPRGGYILVAVFDEGSSLGLVRLYFTELEARLAAAVPVATTASSPALGVDFETDLNRNLAKLFGRI